MQQVSGAARLRGCANRSVRGDIQTTQSLTTSELHVPLRKHARCGEPVGGGTQPMAHVPVATTPALVDGQLVRPRWPMIGGHGGTMGSHGVVIGPHSADDEQVRMAMPVKPFSSMHSPCTVVPAVALGQLAPSKCCAGHVATGGRSPNGVPRT